MLHEHCLSMPREQKSISHVAWTTVIHFYTALQTTCFKVCSRCKILQLGSLQEFGVVTTSLLSSDNFIGCRSDSGSSSNSLSSCIRRCITQRHGIWSKTACQLVSNIGRRRLRSADVDTCIIPPTRTRLGHRSFSVAGPAAAVEQFTSWVVSARCRDRTVQTASVRASLRHIATFLFTGATP